jgi:hypothetical protein
LIDRLLTFASLSQTRMLPHLKAAFQESINEKTQEAKSSFAIYDAQYIQAVKNETQWLMSYAHKLKSVMLAYTTADGKSALVVREVDTADKKGEYPDVLAALRHAKQVGGHSPSLVQPNAHAKNVSAKPKPPFLREALDHPVDGIHVLTALAYIDKFHADWPEDDAASVATNAAIVSAAAPT